MNRIVPLILIAMVGMAACSPPLAFPAPNPTPGGPWEVRLTQTGGLAGVHLVVLVTSDGEMTAEDGRTGRSASAPLSESTLQELRRLVQQVTPPRTEKLPSMCADCFIYDLEITSAIGVQRVQADDSNVGTSGAQSLIDLLTKIRDQALGSMN